MILSVFFLIRLSVSVFLASVYAGVFLEPVLSLTFLVWSRSSEVEKGEEGVCKKKAVYPAICHQVLFVPESVVNMHTRASAHTHVTARFYSATATIFPFLGVV